MKIKRMLCILALICFLLPVMPARADEISEEPQPVQPEVTEVVETSAPTTATTEATQPPTTQPTQPTQPETTPPETTPTQTVPPQTTQPTVPQETEGSASPAPGTPPVMMGYTVSHSPIEKGDTMTIKVSVKHTDVTLNQIGGEQNLDITRMVDSFSGGSVYTRVTSRGNEMLTYDVEFEDLVYNGVGNTLRFLSGYKDSKEPFSTMGLTVVEAVEYQPPQPEIRIPGTPMDSSVPNIVVSDYNYGGGPVAAGGKFPLSITLCNTGKLSVENIVMTIDGGDNFTMDGSSNTFYYSKIGAGKEETQPINMQAVTSAKTGAQSIGVTCKYEYVDGNRRATTTAEVKLSVPVVQPDRFQVNAPMLPENIQSGEETLISLSYVNKGKAEVSNVEATLEGDVEAVAKVQYLGNFEPGKSGSIGFAFTPQEPGKTDITLKIQYEDSSQEIHTLTFPLTLDVQEPMMDFEGELDFADAPTEGKHSVWLFVIPGILVLAGAGGWFYLKKRRSHKKADETNLDWNDWEDETDAQGWNSSENPEETKP